MREKRRNSWEREGGGRGVRKKKNSDERRVRDEDEQEGREGKGETRSRRKRKKANYRIVDIAEFVFIIRHIGNMGLLGTM
jgi:hypothetical protein